MTPQFIRVVEEHPITRGIGDGFFVTDEAYSCHSSSSVQPLAQRLSARRSHEDLNRRLVRSAAWVRCREQPFLTRGPGSTRGAPRIAVRLNGISGGFAEALRGRRHPSGISSASTELCRAHELAATLRWDDYENHSKRPRARRAAALVAGSASMLRRGVRRGRLKGDCAKVTLRRDGSSILDSLGQDIT